MKRKVVIVIVLLGALLLTGVLYWLNTLDFSTDFLFNDNEVIDDYSKDILFYPADYETDIYTIPEYLEKNRYIQYTRGAETTTITDGDYSIYGEFLVFFNEYFNTLKNGDAEKYNDFFTAEYKDNKNYKPYKRFTHQKIYNIEIELLNEDVVETGERYGQKEADFKVGYMIMYNDGTFRRDIDSDGSVPLHFKLIYDGSDVKINNLVRYTIEVN